MSTTAANPCHTTATAKRLQLETQDVNGREAHTRKGE